MATRNYFLQERRSRKMELLKAVKEYGENEGVETEKILGAFSWAWGLRTAKILEYIEELKLAGLVVENQGKLKLTDTGKKVIR